MPLYEYQCPNCGTCEDISTNVERRDDPVECFWCDGVRMNRVPTAASVRFKGSGFHINDYGKQ